MTGSYVINGRTLTVARLAGNEVVLFLSGVRGPRGLRQRHALDRFLVSFGPSGRGGPGENELLTFYQLAADNSAAVVMAFLQEWAERRRRGECSKLTSTSVDSHRRQWDLF